MKRFTIERGQISADLDATELAILRAVPNLIESVGATGVDPAADRLEPVVFADDAARSAEFRRLSSDLIEEARRADVTALTAGIERVASGNALSPDEAEGWLRALTHARLILGARVGIEEDGWERAEGISADPRVAVLHFLGELQYDLIRVLTTAL